MSTVRVTPADEADGADEQELFGPKRIIAFGELTVPEVTLRQTVRVYGIGQWDLRDAEATETTLDSYYGGAAVDGPILPGLFHNVGATISYADAEGISDQTVGTVAQIPLDNLAYGELSYGLRPLASALIGSEATVQVGWRASSSRHRSENKEAYEHTDTHIQK